jgi:hypothetical protein
MCGRSRSATDVDRGSSRGCTAAQTRQLAPLRSLSAGVRTFERFGGEVTHLGRGPQQSGLLGRPQAGWLPREAGIWVVGRELLRRAVVDESVVKQPLDGSALGSSIAQGVPRRDQFGVVFIEFVLESSERSPPLQ